MATLSFEDQCIKALLEDPRTDPNERDGSDRTALSLARDSEECTHALLADPRTETRITRVLE